MKILSKGKKNNDGLVTVVDKRSTAKKVLDFVINNALYFMILALVIFTTFKEPNFIAKAPLDLFNKTAAYVIMALGVGGIIVLTGTDLSAGRVMGITAVVAASLLQNADASRRVWVNLSQPTGIRILLVFLLVIAIGAIIGAFNGFFVAKFDLHPFIVTLSTQLMLQGTVLIYLGLGTNQTQAISNLFNKYVSLVNGFSFEDLINKIIRLFNQGAQEVSIKIPNFAWVSVLMIIIMWFIWNKTTLGKNMYAVGSNPEAAKVSGVNVLGTIISIFTMAGICYAINGFIEGPRVGGPGTGTGVNKELDAIAACVIGGVSFVGGIGKVSGIVIGVILLQLIEVALQWLHIDPNYTYIIKGAIILIAVTLDMRKYISKK